VGRDIDSQALQDINRVLGIAGSRLGSQSTELEDGILYQHLEVSPFVRRAFGLAGTSGIFQAVMQNTHGAGATTETSILDPLTPGGLADPPYPPQVGPNFDFWLLGVGGRAITTASNFGDGTLRLQLESNAQLLGVDEGGAAVAQTTRPLPIAHFTSVSGTVDSLSTPDGDVYVPLNMRIRRGSVLLWNTAANNAVVVELLMICSLVRSAVGQDVVQG